VSEDLHDRATQKLRRISQRYTTGRRVLVEVLANAGRPLTIPEILERDRTLASSSVYRNLVTLEQAGIAAKVITSQEHARFELAEPLGHHHHHLVCDECGKVDDFTLPDAFEGTLDQALRRAARKKGYTPLGHRLDLTGTCPECQAAS
jgi:Fur family transcriptional regulator, ferric uptake regulator